MRLNKGLSLILVLVVVIAPILVAKPAFSQPPVHFSVEPAAVPPLTNVNTTVNGLETPASPSPVGDYFTVTIHFIGATAANIPAGVAGIEMHFNFTDILQYATPVNFTDEVGTFLSSPLYGLGPAWFSATGAKLTGPSGATQYEVAAATSSAGNTADGTVVVLWFQILGQLSGIAGQNFTAPLTISFASAVDGNGNSITVGIVQGTLQIDASLPVLPPQPVVSVIFPATGTSAFTGTYGQLFNASVVITSDPSWDVAGYDINVTWDPTLMTLVSWAPNSFLTQGGAEIFTFNFTTSNSIEVVATKLADPTPSGGTNVALIYLQFNATALSSTYPPPTSLIALGPVDLVSWAHPERSWEPWFGSLTAVDMTGYFSVANGTYTEPFIPLGAALDLYDQYPSPYGGQGPFAHSDAFGPQSLVDLYAKVTFAGEGVPNKLASVEIFAPNSTTPITILVRSTDANGVATTSFRIPQDSSLFGWWYATATAEVEGNIINDTMAFQVGWLVQVTGITANNVPYLKYSGTTMNFTVTVQTISEQTLTQRGWPNATLATEVYDVSHYPIGEALMSIAGISATRNDVNGIGGTTGGISTYAVTMPLPDFARVGAATVTGFVLTAMPINGGYPLGPELTPPTMFAIKATP